MRITRILMAVVFGLAVSMTAFAEEYPTRPVQVIVPFTEGSATDTIARAVSKKLSEFWANPLRSRTGQARAARLALTRSQNRLRTDIRCL